jgi:hypothetical protein
MSARQVENGILLKRLLGSDMQAVGLDQPPHIAQKIIERCSAILIRTRDEVSGLGFALEQAITDALHESFDARRRQPGESEAQLRAEAAMEGVRRTFPPGVVHELVERLWPTLYRADVTDYPVETKKSEIVIPNVPPFWPGRNYTLIVDTDHAFWKETKPDELLQLLVGRSLGDCGIRAIPDTVGRGEKITPGAARIILNSLSREVFLLDSRLEDPTLNNHRGFLVRLKLRHLLAEHSERSPFFGNVADLMNFLSDPVRFNRYVDIIPRGGTGAPPNHTDVFLVQEISNRAFTLFQRQLGLERGRTRLQDVARQQHALHRFRRSFEKGEVTPWDIATAMSMIEQKGELADAMTAGGDRVKIERTSQRLQLAGYLNQLRAIDIPPVSGADLNWSLTNVDTELADIRHDLLHCAPGHVMNCHIVNGVNITNYNVDRVHRRLLDAQRELTQARDVLEKAGRQLVEAYRIIDALPDVQVGTFPNLTTLIDTTRFTVNRGAVQLSTNFRAIADHIQTQYHGLRDEAYYRDELGKLWAETQDLEGKEAVHAVYEAYYRSAHGGRLSERSALNAANELMSRNALDSDLDEVFGDVAETVWKGEGSTQGERAKFVLKGLRSPVRPRLGPYYIPTLEGVPGAFTRRVDDIFRTVAEAFKIEVRGGRPDFAGTRDTEKLVRYYYALKSLIGGEGHMQMPQFDTDVAERMQNLSLVLQRKHARRLLYMFKGKLPEDVGQNDQAIESILDQPEKLRLVMTELLSGPPPEGMKEDIRKGLERADTNFEPWQRRIKDRLLGDRWSVKQAIVSRTNPLSVRNITFGKYGLLILGWKGVRGVGERVKSIGSYISKERKAVLTGALIGTLIAPGLGTIVGASWKKLFGGPAVSSPRL